MLPLPKPAKAELLSLFSYYVRVYFVNRKGEACRLPSPHLAGPRIVSLAGYPGLSRFACLRSGSSQIRFFNPHPPQADFFSLNFSYSPDFRVFPRSRALRFSASLITRVFPPRRYFPLSVESVSTHLGYY